MRYIWANAEHTIGNIVASGGGAVVIDEGHPLWLDFVLAGPEAFIPPPPPEPQPDPVPEMISRFQARAALMAAGLLDQVEAAVSGADDFTRLAWAEATEWRRDSPTLAVLAGGLGLDAAAVDDLFRAAAQIAA